MYANKTLSLVIEASEAEKKKVGKTSNGFFGSLNKGNTNLVDPDPKLTEAKFKAAEWAANTIHESINQPEYPMDMLNPSEKVKANNPLYGFKVSSELIMKLIKTCDNRITPLLVQEQTKDRK